MKKKYIIFAREHSAAEQVWIGKKPSLAEIGRQYGADEVHSIDDVESVVRSHVKGPLHSLTGLSTPFRYRRIELQEALAKMRSVKSQEEIVEMEAAIGITAKAFDAMMRVTGAGVNEQELEALTEYVWRANGGKHAYPPIVTQNGATLHSVNNNDVLADGRLVLADVGCEIDGYAADITRTFPVNGRFTSEQADIYDIVLRAKRETTNMIAPGVPFEDVSDHAILVITEGLKEGCIF